METLGKNIAYYRMKKGLSEEDLARLLSVSKDLILSWERDEREPSPQLLEKLSALYRVPKEVLLETKPKEKIIPVYSYESRGKFVGTCARCGKGIYSTSSYGMGEVIEKKHFGKISLSYNYDPNKNEGHDYFCHNCCQQILALKKQNFKKEIADERSRLSKAGFFSLFLGLIGTVLCVVGAILFHIFLDNLLLTYIVGFSSIVFGYYVFALIYTLLLKDNWIHDTVCSYAKFSFVTLPKKISEKDANDVLKTGFVKAAFLAVSYVLALAILSVLTLLLSLICLSYWPIARKKRISSIEKREQNEKH